MKEPSNFIIWLFDPIAKPTYSTNALNLKSEGNSRLAEQMDVKYVNEGTQKGFTHLGGAASIYAFSRQFGRVAVRRRWGRHQLVRPVGRTGQWSGGHS
jgi:hypothetical protein